MFKISLVTFEFISFRNTNHCVFNVSLDKYVCDRQNFSTKLHDRNCTILQDQLTIYCILLKIQ